MDIKKPEVELPHVYNLKEFSMFLNNIDCMSSKEISSRVMYRNLSNSKANFKYSNLVILRFVQIE